MRRRVEYGLFLRALPLVVLMRVGLWFLHPSYVLRRVETSVQRRQTRAPSGRRAPMESITWAVRATSRRVPKASCLVQALAARMLLASHGYDSELRIGVARGEAFEAHAWIEVDGRRVIGQKGSQRFSALPDVTGALPVSPRRFSLRRFKGSAS